MSSDAYVIGKVREALVQARGDAAAAQRLLLAWAARDGRLLRGLVTPFIKGIVAHAVTRVAAASARPAPAAKPGPGRPAAPPRRQTLTPEALDQVLNQLGKRIGTADPPPRGMTALVTPSTPRPKAGKTHEDSLRKLAVAFARKRLDADTGAKKPDQPASGKRPSIRKGASRSG